MLLLSPYVSSALSRTGSHVGDGRWALHHRQQAGRCGNLCAWDGASGLAEVRRRWMWCSRACEMSQFFPVIQIRPRGSGELLSAGGTGVRVA